MYVSKKFIVLVGTITFLFVALYAAQAGIKGVQAIQTNYTIMTLENYGRDLDNDGIADIYDDSDRDTISDKYDATPFKALDSFVEFTLQ